MANNTPALKPSIVRTSTMVPCTAAPSDVTIVDFDPEDGSLAAATISPDVVELELFAGTVTGRLVPEGTSSQANDLAEGASVVVGCAGTPGLGPALVSTAGSFGAGGAEWTVAKADGVTAGGTGVESAVGAGIVGDVV